MFRWLFHARVFIIFVLQNHRWHYCFSRLVKRALGGDVNERTQFVQLCAENTTSN